jgi:hypothetical protein
MVTPIDKGAELKGLQGWQGHGWTAPDPGSRHSGAARSLRCSIFRQDGSPTISNLHLEVRHGSETLRNIFSVRGVIAIVSTGAPFVG